MLYAWISIDSRYYLIEYDAITMKKLREARLNHVNNWKEQETESILKTIVIEFTDDEKIILINY